MKRISSMLLGAVVILGLSTVSYGADVKTISKGSKVTLNYTLTVDGQVVDSSDGKPPFQYEHGSGMIIPGLSKGLEGLHVGDEKEIVVSPAEGYGEVDPKAFQQVPKSTFPADMTLQPGMMVEMKSNEGQRFPALVSEVKEGTVTLNFNHPLAGKELHFKIKVVGIE